MLSQVPTLRRVFSLGLVGTAPSSFITLRSDFTHRGPFPEWEMEHDGSGGRLLPALDREAWATAQAREPSPGSWDQQLTSHPAGSSLTSCSRPETCTSPHPGTQQEPCKSVFTNLA